MQKRNDEERFNLTELGDLLKIYHALKEQHPHLDELEIISALTNLSGLESPPSTKQEIKKAVFTILRIEE